MRIAWLLGVPLNRRERRAIKCSGKTIPSKEGGGGSAGEGVLREGRNFKNQEELYSASPAASPMIVLPIIPLLSGITAALLSGNYDTYASTYDSLNGETIASSFGVNDLRKRASNFVRGDVLEICIGTALQSDFYDWTAISSFKGVDSSAEMIKLAQLRLNQLSDTSPIPKDLILHDVKSLPFRDSVFDTVIDTFSLCVVDDPLEVIREMKRVTKPRGKVILVENSRSNIPLLGFFQDVSEPIITPLSKNCRWNTDVPKLAQEAGLSQCELLSYAILNTFIFK